MLVVLFSSAEIEAGIVVAFTVFNNVWQPCKSDSDLGLSFIDFVDSVWRFVAPSAYRFYVFFCQMVEHVTDIEVLFDGGSKELEASIAGKFFNLKTENTKTILVKTVIKDCCMVTMDITTKIIECVV